LPPAVQLEEPKRHHIPNTSYQPQEVIGSNKPSATLSENNLRLHTTSNQQHNVQHFVNPMHQQFETGLIKPILDTPPNQGNRKQVGRTPESFLDEHTPQSDKPLLNKKHHLSAEIQTYQPHNQSSKVSHYVQRYQELKTEEEVQNEQPKRKQRDKIKQNKNQDDAQSEQSQRRPKSRPQHKKEESKKDSSKKASKKSSSHKGRGGGGSDGSSSDGSGSDESGSDRGHDGGGSSDGGSSGQESDNTSRTSTNKSRTSPRKRKSKSYPNQVMKTMAQQSNAMAQQSDAIMAICNTMNNLNSNKTSRSEKFKVNYSLQLKHVKLSKGERITAAFVIKTLTAAKEIDIAANKATSRKPQTDNEWQSFFKFHMAHMTDILHEEMSTIVQRFTFTDSHTFWTHVFKRIFPNEIAMDAFDKALSSYMIWNEPLGIERWEAITKTLLNHKAVMSGKVASEIPMYIAEKLAQQLQRLVMACPEVNSATLFREYVNVYAEIREYRDEDRQVTSVMYDNANVRFMRLLKVQLNAYQGTTIFGHASTKDSKVNETITPTPQPSLYIPCPTTNSVPQCNSPNQPCAQNRNTSTNIHTSHPTRGTRVHGRTRSSCPYNSICQTTHTQPQETLSCKLFSNST
jgi:hypothetical protein